MELHDSLGMAGVGIVVVMYLFLQIGRITADNPSFSIGNAIGAAVIEGFWLVLSLYGLGRTLRNRRP
jgi:hypothetical protein